MTDRTRVRRMPERGAYDAATVHAIIDAVLVSHVGFTIDERPFVIPVLHARDGDRLLLHGAS
ncbi:MAG: pyridoxamine 5'-phosphate oxidase family protein, partial [Gemmatimonadetes bacterium]|nr:pyridoxamine 5'-phosphate oxidase family protein [Gemmatimonadota bacterium]